MSKNLFLSGTAGVGKTTLIKEVTLPYRQKLGGFVTEEMRENGRRQGFVLKTFEGKEGVLALKGRSSPYKLNKYGIDLSVLEELGVKAMQEAAQTKELIVIDEIGSMEVISPLFREVLLKCLASPKRVLATIRAGAQPFTDEVKRFQNTEIIALTRDNYLEVKQEVVQWLAT